MSNQFGIYLWRTKKSITRRRKPEHRCYHHVLTRGGFCALYFASLVLLEGCPDKVEQDCGIFAAIEGESKALNPDKEQHTLIGVPFPSLIHASR